MLLLLRRSLLLKLCFILVIFKSIFRCSCVANINTVLSLSCCCLVLIFLSSHLCFYCFLQDRLSVLKKIKILYQVYTNLAYIPPSLMRVKKLRVLMSNKNLCMLLVIINGNNIIIWSWKNCMADTTLMKRNGNIFLRLPLIQN